jgi:sarcosine/dimethylglycine N-methyltransferase
MNDNPIHTQYSTGLSRPNIETAIVAAGKDLDHLQPGDLALVEDFHTMGRIATHDLVELVGITPQDVVLDAGGGIGGTARYLAAERGCKVASIDLTEDYCETARWLNRLVGLDERISVHHGDVTDLPFADATFQVVISQHVQMNVADKTRLYEEAHRVLVGGGRLALWDIVSREGGQPDYPVPWADHPDVSHLVSSERLRAVVESAGFDVEHWEDLTETAGQTMKALMALPPSPLGLQAFVPNFAQKVNNLVSALADGRLQVIQGIARATTP